jgi:hypothetical protein
MAVNAEARLHPAMTAEALAAAGLEDLANKWD